MSAEAPPTVAFAIRGPIAPADLGGLCDRVCALLHGSGAAVALCDVAGVEPDAVTVDALGREAGQASGIKVETPTARQREDERR